MIDESMFEREIILNRFMLAYLRRLVADLQDNVIYQAPNASVNTPGWCLGHLVVECDHALMHLDRPRHSPDAWDALFLMGTTPDVLRDHANAPVKAVLLDTVKASYAALRDAVRETNPAFFEAPCHSAFLQSVLPREADWYAHMLTTHVAMHAGNIALWRRVMGLPAVIG